MYLFNMAGAVIAPNHAIHNYMKLLLVLASLLFVVEAFGQRNPVKLIKQDTVILNLSDTNITGFLLESVYQGKLEARDALTNVKIPPRQIYTWKTSTDSMMVWDAKKQENSMQLVREKIKPEQIGRMKLYMEWQFNSSTGKLEAVIKEWELQKVMNSPSGSFIGYNSFCRIR
jgi:hypothetical protein